jgi:hypothetical protein
VLIANKKGIAKKVFRSSAALTGRFEIFAELARDVL